MMKTRFLIQLLLIAHSITSIAQNFSTKSNSLLLDLSNPTVSHSSTYPSIKWLTPENETIFLKDGNLYVDIEIASKVPLSNIKLQIKDKETGQLKGSLAIPITDEKKRSIFIQKNITLTEGVSDLLVTAENENGMISFSRREIHVGATALADASKLLRKDYALIFATDKYDHWNSLTNPVFDARTIAENLEKTYGFTTEIIENATQPKVLDKFREYAEKKYADLDQLFIFFAGHGFYDDTFKEGFVVTTESLPDDPGRNSYLRHSVLRSIINNNPCRHIFLVMDVCFGGTFDETTSSRNTNEMSPVDPSQSEFIIRKLKYKTRMYLTSGGKEYVSDGIPGNHSPFARQFINALEKGMGNNGILTISELTTHVETLKVAPQFGRFGTDQPGSDFLFVVKGK